jgi:DNA-binding response OmpR family regulator
VSFKGTILIVEDQAGFRLIFGDLLKHEGYEVLTAEDGLTGWETAKEKKPSLVLLDLGLPKMDGLEVLRRIRADDGTKDIPVIIFSVMGEQAEVNKAMALGANDYTVKGFFTPRQILSKIRSLLILMEPEKNAVPYRMPMKGGGAGMERIEKEIGLTEGYRCPACGVAVVVEMFPDYVREGTHWFSSRLICPECGKSA